MSPRITSLCTNLTYHLRNNTRIRWFLDRDSCHHLVRSRILSKLDYANAVLLGTKVANISRLQRLQNWTANIIFCATKLDHATPFINELEWLTIKNRIIFKIMVIVCKCFSNLRPSYLASTHLHAPAEDPHLISPDLLSTEFCQALLNLLLIGYFLLLLLICGTLCQCICAQYLHFRISRKVLKRTFTQNDGLCLFHFASHFA